MNCLKYYAPIVGLERLGEEGYWTDVVPAWSPRVPNPASAPALTRPRESGDILSSRNEGSDNLSNTPTGHSIKAMIDGCHPSITISSVSPPITVRRVRMAWRQILANKSKG